jgi:uncharacterized protein (DUF2062 family)
MSTLFSRPFARIIDWLGRNMPTREQMEHNRFIPKSVLRAELWRFTRRSVPRGIALGIIVGVLLPFAQIIFAAILSLPVRANVPLAALTTFITNPFTTPLIWALSYQVGRGILQVNAATVPEGPIDALSHVHDVWSLLHWISDEGKILIFGLFVVTTISASVGYLLASFAWKFIILRKRRLRTAR